ncbi:MAG: oligosaccharide flippase family protein [Anaerolineales bacterium]
MLRSLYRLASSSLKRFLSHPLLQRVVRNTGYLFSAQTIAAGLSMGQGILTARLLGVEGAGLVGIITQFSSNVYRLISSRMSELVVSFVGEFTAKEQDAQAAAVFKAAAFVELAGSIVAYGLVVLLSSLAARYFAHNPQLANLFALYGIYVLASLFSESAIGLLQYFNRFGMIAYATVGQSVLTISLIVAAFMRQGDLRDVVIAYLVGKVTWGLFMSLAGLWQAQKAWGRGWWRAPLSLLAPRRADLVRFGISTNLSGTIKLISRDSEMLWLAYLSTPLHVGYYKIAKAIMNILMTPVAPLISTTYREVAREVANRHWGNVRYLLRSGTILAASWTLPASLGLVLVGPWVIGLYGPDFLPISYTNILILLVGVITVNIFYWNQLVLLPLGLPDYPTKVHFVFAIGKVIGTILLVPVMGANGMAVLFSAYLLVTTAALVWKTLRELQRVSMEPVQVQGG